MKDSAGLVQTVFHKPASAIAGFFENLSDLRNTYEENKNLKEVIENLNKNNYAVYVTQVAIDERIAVSSGTL